MNKSKQKYMNKIKLGIIGGGGDSLIGILHRIASNMYDKYEIVGGVFNPDYEEKYKFCKRNWFKNKQNL